MINIAFSSLFDLHKRSASIKNFNDLYREEYI